MTGVRAGRTLLTVERRNPVYHWMDGWDWFWMSFVMVLWAVIVGAVVYVAVRLANRPPDGPKARS